MENITVANLKTQNLHILPVNYKILKDGKIIIKGRNNQRYILNNVQITRRGSHIIIRDKNDVVVLPSRFEKSLFSGISLLLVIIVIIVSSFLWFRYSNQKNNTTEDKIKELNLISTSLINLENYVSEQKETLVDLSSTISKLNEEKSGIENILQIDKNKLDSLLSHQNRLNKRNTYIGYFLSFIIGILSTFAANFIIKALKSYKENQELKDE